MSDRSKESSVSKSPSLHPNFVSVQGTPSQRPSAAEGNAQEGAALTVVTLSPDALVTRIAQLRAMSNQTAVMLPGLQALPEGERKALGAYLREGESAAITAVFQTVEVRADLRSVIARKGGEATEGAVDIAALGGQVAKANALDELAAHYKALAQRCADTAMVLRAEARDVASDAYEILRPFARHDPAIRTALQPAIDFYAKIGRKGARTRAKANEGESPAPKVPG